MTHLGAPIARRDALEIINCETCGFAHLNPIPFDEINRDFYRDFFWQTTKPGALQTILDEAEWWQRVYGDWLSILQAPGKRLLDVGCGYGLFIETARAYGWNCVGVEPSDAARINGLSHCPVVSLDNPPREMNDVLSMQWLLEHLADPERALRFWAERLVPGGTLFLVVPNEFTPWQKRADAITKNPGWWIHPTHINYFTKASLIELVKRCGFVVIDELATYPMERWLIEVGIDYPADPEAGNQCHKVVRDEEMAQSREQRLSYARTRAEVGTGRDLIIVARKM